MENYVIKLRAEDGEYVKTYKSIGGVQRYLVDEEVCLTPVDISKIESGECVGWVDEWGRFFKVFKAEVGKCCCCGKTLPLDSKYLEITTEGVQTYHKVMLCNVCFDKDECGEVQAYLTKYGEVKFKENRERN